MSIIDRIDQSLNKASELQMQRIESEQKRQKSLNSEISQLRRQLVNNNIDNDIDEQSNYSPLRADIKQLELQNELLNSSDHQIYSSHQKEFESEESDTDPDEMPIEPIYTQQRNHNQYQVKHPSHQQRTHSSTMKQQQQQQQKKNQHQKQNKEFKNNKQNKIPKNKTIPNQKKYIPSFQDINLKEEKENQQNYVIQEDKYEYQNLNQRVQQIKQVISEQLVTKKPQQKISKTTNPQEFVNEYKIRGLRDQAEMKYFGRVLPCNECVYLLNKGYSTDFCSQHGKAVKERARNKVVPKRFEKYY